MPNEALLILNCFLIFCLPCITLQANALASSDEFFEIKIRPLLAGNCYLCHSKKAKRKGKLKAGLTLKPNATREQHAKIKRFLDKEAKRIGKAPKEAEFGLSAVENRVHVHVLHATILHLMGLDHEKLTYRYSGRDYRLTDVHGHVVHEIIA